MQRIGVELSDVSKCRVVMKKSAQLSLSRNHGKDQWIDNKIVFGLYLDLSKAFDTVMNN